MVGNLSEALQPPEGFVRYRIPRHALDEHPSRNRAESMNHDRCKELSFASHMQIKLLLLAQFCTILRTAADGEARSQHSRLKSSVVAAETYSLFDT